MPLPFIVKRTKGLKYTSLQNASGIARFIHFIMMRKASIILKRIEPSVQGTKILDVGMGAGSISYFLKKKGFDVTSVDVANLSMYEDLQPVLYDGKKLPFATGEFDTAVIIHVLHHCDDGVQVLKEAKRVAKRVIFIEDTYRNPLEWFIISVSDAVNNGELWFHTYRKVSEWKKIIKENEWKLITYSTWSEWAVAAIYGRYCMFVIE